MRYSLRRRGRRRKSGVGAIEVRGMMSGGTIRGAIAEMIGIGESMMIAMKSTTAGKRRIRAGDERERERERDDGDYDRKRSRRHDSDRERRRTSYREKERHRDRHRDHRR